MSTQVLRSVRIVVSEELSRYSDTWVSLIGEVPGDTFSLELPYFLNGQSTSAFEWGSLCTSIIRELTTGGWHFIGGRPNPVSLGLNTGDQFPVVLEQFAVKYTDAPPKVSVVVAIYNREHELPSFWRSLQQQTASTGFELILVDDGSTDASFQVMVSLATSTTPFCDCKLVKLSRDKPYRPMTFTFRAGVARDVGSALARASHVLFIDPDQEVAPDCIAQHYFYARAGFNVVIGDRIMGRQSVRDVSNHWSRLQYSSISGSDDWWMSFFTGNSSVQRSWLKNVGGFDRSLLFWGLDDTDLGYRLARSGATCIHTTRARVRHSEGAVSGGGESDKSRRRAFRLHAEVLYRKYFDESILNSFAFVGTE